MYRGVFKDKKKGYWVAYDDLGENKRIGIFKNANEAGRAYNKYVVKKYGSKQFLNIVRSNK